MNHGCVLCLHLCLIPVSLRRDSHSGNRLTPLLRVPGYWTKTSQIRGLNHPEVCMQVRCLWSQWEGIHFNTEAHADAPAWGDAGRLWLFLGQWLCAAIMPFFSISSRWVPSCTRDDVECIQQLRHTYAHRGHLPSRPQSHAGQQTIQYCAAYQTGIYTETANHQTCKVMVKHICAYCYKVTGFGYNQSEKCRRKRWPQPAKRHSRLVMQWLVAHSPLLMPILCPTQNQRWPHASLFPAKTHYSGVSGNVLTWRLTGSLLGRSGACPPPSQKILKYQTLFPAI